MRARWQGGECGALMSQGELMKIENMKTKKVMLLNICKIENMEMKIVCLNQNFRINPSPINARVRFFVVQLKCVNESVSEWRVSPIDVILNMIQMLWDMLRMCLRKSLTFWACKIDQTEMKLVSEFWNMENKVVQLRLTEQKISLN